MTDIPCYAFAEELIAVYPDAKVILTVRDNAQAWKRSMEKTIVPNAIAFTGGGIVNTLLGLILPTTPTAEAFPLIVKYTRIRDIPWDGIRMYEDHVSWIRRLVPEDRLLVYNVKDGWSPLCQFLGHSVPKDKAYPHANSEDAYLRGLEAYQKNMLGIALRRISFVVVQIVALTLGATVLLSAKNG